MPPPPPPQPQPPNPLTHPPIHPTPGVLCALHNGSGCHFRASPGHATAAQRGGEAQAQSPQLIPPSLQLTERRKGNEAYKRGDFRGALRLYHRAAAIVDFVRGLSRADQAEVDVNKVAVHLNIAAAHMALKEYGNAVEQCSKALELEPGKYVGPKGEKRGLRYQEMEKGEDTRESPIVCQGFVIHCLDWHQD